MRTERLTAIISQRVIALVIAGMAVFSIWLIAAEDASADLVIVLTNVSPAEGPSTGGNTVSIYADDVGGPSLLFGAEVYFGDVLSPNVTYIQSDMIMAEAPAHVPGPVDIRVVNPDLDEGLMVDAYEYLAVEGDTADNPILIQNLPFTATQSTCGFTQTRITVGCVGPWSGEDVFYTFIAPIDTTVEISLCTDEIDLAVLAGETTGIVGNFCSTTPSDSCSVGGVYSFRMVTGDTVLFWVDSAPDMCGEYSLEVQYVRGSCQLHINAEPEYISAPWALHEEGGEIVAEGAGDATIQNLPTGVYELTWLDVPGWLSPNPNPTVFDVTLSYHTVSGTYIADYPEILEAVDVPQDQGYQVSLAWERCGNDIAGDPLTITGYEIYRRHDVQTVNAPMPSHLDFSGPYTHSQAFTGWYYLATVPAHGEESYEYVANTLCNCSEAGDECPSAFLVRAATSDPFQFFDSQAAIVCSVDNLAPGVPTTFSAGYLATGVLLDWDDSPEEDFQFYRIYRSIDPGFTSSHENLVYETAASAWNDDTANPWDFHYKVTTLDHAGNESEAASPSWVTGVQDGTVPLRNALLGAVPNPFNPQTTIAFDLSSELAVCLRVYDLAGRQIKTLLDDEKGQAGRNEVVWKGRYSDGRDAPAGVYLYRLEAGGYVETKRMTLLK